MILNGNIAKLTQGSESVEKGVSSFNDITDSVRCLLNPSSRDTGHPTFNGGSVVIDSISQHLVNAQTYNFRLGMVMDRMNFGDRFW